MIVEDFPCPGTENPPRSWGVAAAARAGAAAATCDGREELPDQGERLLRGLAEDAVPGAVEHLEMAVGQRFGEPAGRADRRDRIVRAIEDEHRAGHVGQERGSVTRPAPAPPEVG